MAGAGKAHIGAVLGVDVPVQLHQQVLHFHGCGGAHATDVVTLEFCCRCDLIDLRLGNRYGLRETAAYLTKLRLRPGAGKLLIAGKKEELVFHDRAAQSKAFGVFTERGVAACTCGWAKAVAHKLVIAVHVVNAAFEFVGAGLAHGVDVGAGVVFLRHIVVRQIDLHCLNRVDGNWLFDGGQAVGLQAKGVVDLDAVNRDSVVPGVLSAGRNFATLFIGLCKARV